MAWIRWIGRVPLIQHDRIACLLIGDQSPCRPTDEPSPTRRRELSEKMGKMGMKGGGGSGPRTGNAAPKRAMTG